MQHLIAVSVALDRFNTRVGKLAAWLLLPLVAVIIVDVITRKFSLLTIAKDWLIDRGDTATADFIGTYLTSTKFQELEWHLHAALFLLCLGFAYVRNGHVRIELVRERFSADVKAWLELAGCAFFLLPYAALVLYFSYDFALRSYNMGEVSSSLTGLSHRWIIKSFVPISMVLVLLAGASVAIRNVVFLFGTPELRDRARAMAPELHVPGEGMKEAAEKQMAETTGEETDPGGDPPPPSPDTPEGERT